MKGLWRRIECWMDGHWYEHVKNIYGFEEIQRHSGMRSEWCCQHCGKKRYRDWLLDTKPKEKQ